MICKDNIKVGYLETPSVQKNHSMSNWDRYDILRGMNIRDWDQV